MAFLLRSVYVDILNVQGDCGLNDAPQTDRNGGMPRDWFRPIPVGRFAAIPSPVSAKPFTSVTSIGQMVTPEGGDSEPGIEIPGWPTSTTSAAAEVLVGYDIDNIYFRIICEEPALDRIRYQNPELYRNDHVLLCIDPLNDHHRYLGILALPDGRCQVSWNSVLYGYVPGDLSVYGDGGAGAVHVAAAACATGWSVDITVPWRSLDITEYKPGHCLGLNVNRFRTVGAEELMQWSPTYGLPRDCRYFGDLYIGGCAAVLQEVRLGSPHWGENRGYARFATSKPLWVWVEPRESVKPLQAEPVCLEAGPYGFAGFHFGYDIDPLDILAGRLTLCWSDRKPLQGVPAAGATLSEASFVFGWKRSVLLTHSPERKGKPLRPKDTSASKFFAMMCDYLYSRLPCLYRQGGRYLVGNDDVRIDLLAADPLMPLAQMVADRIEGLDDQLAACALVLCQPEVLVSSSVMNRLVHATNPQSVLWVGGAFCDVYSMVLAALVERLGRVSGRKIPTGLFWLPTPEGTRHPWPNHWWTCLWLDRGPILLDAELGRFFYRRDAVTLATIDDLFADPTLADTSGTGLGDYFRFCTPSQGSVRTIPHYRDIRPQPGD